MVNMADTPFRVPEVELVARATVPAAQYAEYEVVRRRLPSPPLGQLDPAIRASTVVALDGLPFPVRFRKQGAPGWADSALAIVARWRPGPSGNRNEFITVIDMMFVYASNDKGTGTRLVRGRYECTGDPAGARRRRHQGAALAARPFPSPAVRPRPHFTQADRRRSDPHPCRTTG